MSKVKIVYQLGSLFSGVHSLIIVMDVKCTSTNFVTENENLKMWFEVLWKEGATAIHTAQPHFSNRFIFTTVHSTNNLAVALSLKVAQKGANFLTVNTFYILTEAIYAGKVSALKESSALSSSPMVPILFCLVMRTWPGSPLKGLVERRNRKNF